MLFQVNKLFKLYTNLLNIAVKAEANPCNILNINEHVINKSASCIFSRKPNNNVQIALILYFSYYFYLFNFLIYFNE
jgi:hypothetical protein